MFRFLSVSFLMVFSTCLAFGQGTSGGGSGSVIVGPSSQMASILSKPVQLQVKITWPNNRTVRDPIHVYLLTSTYSQVIDLFNQGDGMVVFSQVLPGRYRLKMEGETIRELTTDIFEVQPRQQSVVQWVQVQPKNSESAGNTSGEAMISAVELNAPPKASSEYAKGMEALAKGDLKKATERFEKAVELYPKYGFAWSNLGLVRIRLKDTAGAREAWLKAIAVDDKLVSAYVNLARLDLEENKLTTAGDGIAKALQVDPTNVEALALLANQQLRSGQYEKAVATADKVHSMPHEHLAEVHLIAGDALQHENKTTEAIAQYDLYLREDPKGPKVAQARAAMAQLEARQQSPQKNDPN